MPLIYDDEAQRPAPRLVFDDEQKPAPKYIPESEVFGTDAKIPTPTQANGGKWWEKDPIAPSPEAAGKWWEKDPIAPSLVFDDGKPAAAPAKPGKRTWTEAAGDTAIDLAKGVVGLGESAVGLADLATGNLVGKGLGAIGYDPERTSQALSSGYSDSRTQANRNVADAKGFWNTAGAMIDNPSMAVGAVVESAPMMLGGAGAVRAAATRMLAARGLVVGSTEAAAFLANPAVVARLTAIGATAEGAMTAGNIQEQGRQAGRDYLDTAPSAVAGGVLTGIIGAATSKIPGFRDAEVGAALAGMGGGKRQGLITAGKEIAKGTFKEGVLEEMPQSAQEQVFTNLALGKPWDEGVPEAAAQGMIAGAGMGGSLTAYSSGRNALASTVTGPAAAPTPEAAPAAPQSQAAAPAAAKPATAMRPEVRLAELELATQGRDLTAQEQGEFSTLLSAMDAAESNPDPFNPTQAPAFEDVPDFPPSQAAAPGEQPAPAPGEPVAEQPAARTSWDGLQNNDRVQTAEGVTGTLKFGPGRVDAVLVTDQNFDGSPNVEKKRYSIQPNEVQPVPQAAPQPKLNWFGFLKEKGVAPASVKKDTPQWTALKAEFEGRKVGAAVASPAAVLPPAMPPGAVPAASPAMPGALPVTPTTNPSGQDLQNRDRSRAASVLQMSNIANNPDYMRLGASRTPDSGAPMVFPVGDDDIKLPAANLGRHDVAVMSDGQRVPFIYAVMDASQVEPSHFADGRVNPVYEFKVNGTIKALNNGRVAGLRAAHEKGTAETYKAELIKDAAVHGIAAEVIDRTPNAILVRAYSDASNTPNMAAKSQGQGLGMSPGELARQDAPLMDATVLTAYRPGDVGSAANRDFVRAFVGKMVQAGQDVAGMMTAGGTLSPAGRTRIQAAMVQSAYGDADLVGEMFDSQDTDIKTIGESLKTMAGQWADMRDSARMGAIDAQSDVTDNLNRAR